MKRRGLKAGSVLGQGADACVFQESVQCTVPELTDKSRGLVSKVLPTRKAMVEQETEKEISLRVDTLGLFEKPQVKRHVIVNELICTPKFQTSDLQTKDKLLKCETLSKQIQQACPDCMDKNEYSEAVLKTLGEQFFALQTPKQLTTLWSLMTHNAKNAMKDYPETRMFFQRAPNESVDVVCLDVMRTCLLMNPDSASTMFVHQDLHANNIAVTVGLRGSLADFGRSMFLRKTEPKAFVKEMLMAATQNNNLPKSVETLKIQNDLEGYSHFVPAQVQILQSILCLEISNATQFLTKNAQWKHPKTPVMKEYDLLQKAAFVDNTEKGLEEWQNFLWNRILPFVDFFTVQNNASAISSMDGVVKAQWTPSIRNLSYEFNEGTLTSKHALITVTNALARTLGKFHAMTQQDSDVSDFMPGDARNLYSMVQKAYSKPDITLTD